jgi:hypothetical protein
MMLFSLLLCFVSIVSINAEKITHIHAVFMNHLDVGFDGISPEIGFAANVINKYFNVYFPAAINTAMEFHRRNGTEQYVFRCTCCCIFL